MTFKESDVLARGNEVTVVDTDFGKSVYVYVLISDSRTGPYG